MTTRTVRLDDELRDYLLGIMPDEHPALARLRRENDEHPLSRFQIAPEQGRLLAFLVRLIGARKAIEIGVFTGYSSLAVALAMPDEAKIVACDSSEEFTAVALRYWREAGVDHKIDLRLGPALETLDRMIARGEDGAYDFAFVDADKENEEAYFGRVLELLRPGGLVAVDNVLWSGRVADPNNLEADTIAIRNFNEKIRDDKRVDMCVVPIGDGLTLASKL